MTHLHARMLMFLALLGVAPLGAASFYVPIAYLAGNNSGTAAVGDFNGDGKPDVAAGDGSSNICIVSILIGNGDGTLRDPVNYVVSSAPGSYPNAITVGDFNGDGKLDLAVNVINPKGYTSIAILLGNGDGTFQPPIFSYLPIVDLGRAAAADFNGDGKLDLAVPSQHGEFFVMLGKGDGTFGPPTSYATAGTTAALVIGDFNRDGKPDVAVTIANYVTSKPGIVQVWLNAGAGTFQASYSQNVRPDASAAAVADFNGDGIADLAIACQNPSGAVGILLGNGDGTFQPAVYNLSVGSLPYSIAIGDFNGDGKPDVAVEGGEDSPGIDILLNQDGVTFTVDNVYYSGSYLTVADMNRDGRADLVLSGSSVFVLLGGGDGRFQHVPSISLGRGHNMSSQNSVSVADFNGDGKLDLAVTDPLANGVLILAGNGDGTFRFPVGYSLGEAPSSMAIGDFNGDGKLDLAVAASSSSASNLFILFGNGDGTFQSAVTVGGPASYVVAADFNHDGKLDLAITASPLTCESALSILLGNGNGTFQPPITYGQGNLCSPGPIAIADFNSDGNLDLAVVQTDGNVSILLGAGDGTFGPPVDYSVGNRPISIAVGDFTGHGKRDLAVANIGYPPSSSTVSILLCNGDGTFQPAVNYAAGVWPASVVVADFSGHGKDDVAVASSDSDAVFIFGGNGDGTFQPGTAFAGGSFPYSLAVGDFNRDGRPDLIVGGSANILFEMLNDTR